MPSSLLFDVSEDRLTYARWMILVHAWLAVRAGAHDDRHGGNYDKWCHEVKQRMPLSVREPDLGNFAVSTGEPDILDIVYSGITPSGHVSHHADQNIPIGGMVFDGLIRFRNRFNTKFSTAETALMLRHILEVDDPALLDHMKDTDEQALFRALRYHPNLLEYTGPRMAPLMADFLKGWVEFSNGKMLSVFLICCGEGCAKSICAMIAAGFNPFITLNGNPASWANPIQKAILFHEGETGAATFPQPFLKLLAYLDPNLDVSSHQRIQRWDLIGDCAAQNILARCSESRIANIAKQDWRDEGRIAG